MDDKDIKQNVPDDDDSFVTPRRLQADNDGITAEDEDDLIGEYEARYYGAAPDDDAEPKAKRGTLEPLQPHEERLWAAIAHGSILLPLPVGLASGGTAMLALLFVPLLIYFLYRERSHFVAFHALQAFTFQVAATLGYLLAVIAGVLLLAVGWVLSALSLLVLVGVVLIPIMFLITLVAVIAMVAAPFAFWIYGGIVAVEVYNGTDRRIPRIAEWVENRMEIGDMFWAAD
jgi:hypothetical protein